MPPSVPFPPTHLRPSQPATQSARIIGFSDGPEGANISQLRGQPGIQPPWEVSNPQTIDSRPDIGGPLGEQQISPDEAEDPFDVSDEEDMMGEDEDEPWEEEIQDDHLKNNDLGIVVALQASQDNQAVSLRSFTSFIDRPNMLATYVPSTQTTPMRDRMTARIFCHFVNVTGPSMSMFERHPANPSLIFQGAPVPRSQQHIWACKARFPWCRNLIDRSFRYLPDARATEPGSPTCNACSCKPSHCKIAERTHYRLTETLRNRPSSRCKKC